MQYRQGDVFIERTNAKITGAEVPRDNGRVVLAYGEATGHAHAIARPGVTMFRDAELNRVFLHVPVGDVAELEHEEHDTIKLPPGDYEVILQREYDPEAIRNVAD